jgi:hypothetical protein
MQDTNNLGFFYALCLAAFLALALAASHLLDDTKPLSFEDHADRLCQELYGPQVGHKWVDKALHCETVRGEIVEVRKP